MTKVLAEKIENHGPKKIFGIVIFVIIMTGCFYLYFLGTAIKGIIENGNNVKYLQSAGYEYQKLEEKYFKIVGQIDINYARSLGFIDQSKSEFATREITMARR
jgi:hypothetical protein